MAKLIAKRYAEALFEVGFELDKLEQFKDEIKSISSVFESEPKLNNIFTHPRLSKSEKKDILSSLFQGKVSNEVLNLCYITVDKGRERYLKDISEEYKKISNIAQGIVEAKAITAIPMDDKEVITLQNKLSSQLGKKVILSNIVDKSIVGGVLVKLGNKVIDGSIKGRLEQIQRDLNNIRVTQE
ncbi:ATP synthase subunit delta [Gottschalkia purinilytica]|uniref:ATP synthase subunit delta n=1 Tax=Gottschalkia purinilytica TaxID=1503 RepID=A0A0L0WE11_GOTPU|nr:F0F1 ATP synthase subunit delta [Gottschalkia purinilytica]KNF09717.1 ATP synthase subunit delta [Gottschalkia purinilytica]